LLFTLSSRLSSVFTIACYKYEVNERAQRIATQLLSRLALAISFVLCFQLAGYAACKACELTEETKTQSFTNASCSLAQERWTLEAAHFFFFFRSNLFERTCFTTPSDSAMEEEFEPHFSFVSTDGSGDWEDIVFENSPFGEYLKGAKHSHAPH
jgi:hypothetical protein